MKFGVRYYSLRLLYRSLYQIATHRDEVCDLYVETGRGLDSRGSECGSRLDL
jgi:hypothetical protein